VITSARSHTRHKSRWHKYYSHITMSVRDSKVKLTPIGDNQPLDFAYKHTCTIKSILCPFPLLTSAVYSPSESLLITHWIYFFPLSLLTHTLVAVTSTTWYTHLLHTKHGITLGRTFHSYTFRTNTVNIPLYKLSFTSDWKQTRSGHWKVQQAYKNETTSPYTVPLCMWQVSLAAVTTRTQPTPASG
jgi:hypothetical protein